MAQNDLGKAHCPRLVDVKDALCAHAFVSMISPFRQETCCYAGTALQPMPSKLWRGLSEVQRR
jgi:hypothetical protein